MDENYLYREPSYATALLADNANPWHERLSNDVLNLLEPNAIIVSDDGKFTIALNNNLSLSHRNSHLWTFLDKLQGVRKKPKNLSSVYSCFTTKGVHLKVSTDWISAAFLGALRRFIGIRGQRNNILCLSESSSYFYSETK